MLYMLSPCTRSLPNAHKGYIGHGEGGLLHSTVARRPYCCVVFDHIAAAHPDVQQLLVQILQTGSLTDSNNRRISFQHALIVLTHTTNEASKKVQGNGSHAVVSGDASHVAHQHQHAAADALGTPDDTVEAAGAAATAVGASQLQGAAPNSVKTLPSALVEHVDDVITLQHLSAQALHTVAASQLDHAAVQLQRMGVVLHVEPDVAAWIAAHAHTAGRGAAAVPVLVRRHVQVPLAALLSEGTRAASVGGGDTTNPWRVAVSVAGEDALRVAFV